MEGVLDKSYTQRKRVRAMAGEWEREEDLSMRSYVESVLIILISSHKSDTDTNVMGGFLLHLFWQRIDHNLCACPRSYTNEINQLTKWELA